MVLGVVSNKGNGMAPHFFTQGSRVNTAAYIEVPETVVKPWTDSIRGGNPYIFQEASAPSHKAIAENFHDHKKFNLWPPNAPDLNPLDYYIWGVDEHEIKTAFAKHFFFSKGCN